MTQVATKRKRRSSRARPGGPEGSEGQGLPVLAELTWGATAQGPDVRGVDHRLPPSTSVSSGFGRRSRTPWYRRSKGSSGSGAAGRP